MSAVKKQFEAAAAAVLKAKKDPGNDLKLKLYAHYKQATEGDCSGKRPGLLDPVGRAKWDAWDKLKGTGTDEAMQDYVDLIESLG